MLQTDLKNLISSGKYDKYFASLYSCLRDEVGYYRERALRIVEGFKKEFPGNAEGPRLFSSPGRLELTGNHTDHQGGMVLTGTVNADILACVAKNGIDEINILSEGYGKITLSCNDTELKPEEKNTTTALVRGMLKAVGDAGFKVGGFDMYAASDVPAGLGMSSSAAFEILIGRVMNDLFCGGVLSNEQIAYAGMYAERKYFGKPCGLMDQMACITGGINIFNFEDADRPMTSRIDFDFESAGLDIIVTDTGTDHADMAEDFNAIPEEMYSVAKALGGERLCDIEENVFYEKTPELREKVGDRAIMRAMHWYDEVKRVRLQKEVLEEKNVGRFLEIVRASGRSSFMYLQNIDNYKDPKFQSVALSLALADHLLGDKGAVRIQGGGFAGSIIAFVPKEMSDDYITNMEKLLGAGSCRRVKIRSKV